MSRRGPLRVGRLQLEILKVLWGHGEANVQEVKEALGDADRLAYTTVATMLTKMEKRRLVKRRVDGRRYVYSAAVASDTLGRGMVGDLLDRLFEGRMADMVSHLLEAREVSNEELRELEAMIARRRRKR